MSKRRVIPLLILIMIFGAFLRLWGLGGAEITFDEGLYAFRGIGYLDYLDSAAQSTPIQWLEGRPTMPFWMNLSFHDHPPVIFFIQHLFFSSFGDSLFVARLPSALFGITSIFLVYLVGLSLFSKAGERARKPALISAAIFAVSFAAVSVSRLAMMESVLFFFILLNLYFFLNFLENPKKYWFWFGLTLGLAFLTKYISFFIVPAYIIYIIITQFTLLKNRYLYLAMLLAVLVFSPVLVYNFYLYKIFGHFDLQFSYLLHQNTPEWQGISGKTQEPFSNLGENLFIMYSILFLAAVAGGIFTAFQSARRGKRSWLLIFLFLILITLLLVPVGAALRFVALYILPAVFLAAAFAWFFLKKYGVRILPVAVLGLFLTYEVFFSVNLLFLNSPDYGAVKLDNYFDNIFKGMRSEAIPRHPNPFLNDIIQKFASRRPVGVAPSGIIYDDNLDSSSSLWLFSRRQFYEGIPIIPASVFEEKLRGKDTSMFQGYALYFVKAGLGAPLKSVKPAPYTDDIEKFLNDTVKIKPDIIIKSGDGQIAFLVYKFSITSSPSR